MPKKDVNFVLPLANVDDSVVGLEIMPNFIIETWKMEKLVKLIKEFEGDRPNIDGDIEYACGLSGNSENVIVISGRVSKDIYWKKHDKSASFNEKFFDHGLFSKKVNDKIKLIRLFKEGQIDTKGIYIYDIDDGKIEPIASGDLGEGSIFPIPYSISPSEFKMLTIFLRKYNLPLELPYLNLAFENFILSYDVDHTELALLALMMGVEAIFNEGHYELKYRISRGMAVLLGDKYDSNDIYKDIKNIYDKRSKLLHTGYCKELTFNDVGRLRFMLRETINNLLILNIPKSLLSKKLTEAGFDCQIKAK